MNSSLNEHFPPFLNAKKLGLNFGLQGLQFTATSTTAENQAYCNPVYVHSIPNNNDNQDIVSMGTNSALMAKHVLENTFQVMAVQLIALCQAIDLLGETEKSKLSSKTKELFQGIRSITPFIEEDKPQAESIQHVYDYIREKSQ